MKNQYFGDINDYWKYGLLRSINRVADFRILVAWMLTPNDGSTDGKFTKYLTEPKRWSTYDPSLYLGLCDLLNSNDERSVSQIERTKLLGNSVFFSEQVPDKGKDRASWFTALSEKSPGETSGTVLSNWRASWFTALSEKSQDCNFVFLDPDNGLEVKTKPYGRQYSSKYLFWREIESLWNSGKSLLIYQHFIFEKRINFIQRMLGSLSGATTGSYVGAFSTPRVVFLMALQPEHHHLHKPIVKSVQDGWAGQIHHWELT